MSEREVSFEKRGRAGIVTLNRPQALNALTLDMVRSIDAQLRTWETDDHVAHVVIRAAGEKAFCAGGDIRALYDWGREKDPAFLDFYREEYRLNAYIKRYPKPYTALMTGITMGGGVGLSVHGSHRVASEALTFAMPETGIGLFPDVGGTYFLPRCPGEIGMYLALTGARLKAADALYAGIVTHFVPGDQITDLFEKLTQVGEPEKAIAAVSRDPGAPGLPDLRDRIDRCFGGNDVEAVLSALDGDATEWASRLAETVRGKSPTSTRITFRQIREGARLDFEDCMRLEYRMVNRIPSGHDFFEGIRAVVVDKDQTPQWDPATLADVSDDLVAAYFEPLEDELDFSPPR